jgi:predicted transcriptional regulator
MTRETGISCENDLGELMRVGTHEAKAIVLGGMKPGRDYDHIELHEELFLEPQGSDPVYKGAVRNQYDYCAESLEPAGCVQELNNGWDSYILTPFGEREGQAYAGHVLALSLDAGEVGLRSLYGMARTGSAGKTTQPPLDRVRTFRGLLSNGGMQISEIKELLGVSQNTASRSLQWLGESGIVNYESMAPGTIAERLTYTFPENPEKLDLPLNDAPVRKMIDNTLRELAEAGRQHTLADVMGALQSRYPGEGFDGQNRRTYTIGVMNKLVEDSVITKNMDGKSRRSTLTVQDQARPLVERVVAIADSMLEGDEDFLREGREQLRIILGDQEKVRALVGKAFRHSPEANGLPFAERFSHVAAYLGGEPASSSEIAARVEAHGMTPVSTRRTLQAMRRRGLAISRPAKGGELEWELVPGASAA